MINYLNSDNFDRYTHIIKNSKRIERKSEILSGKIEQKIKEADIFINKKSNSIHLSFYTLASSDRVIARFVTDSSALIALGMLISLHIKLIKYKAGFKNLWISGNSISNRLKKYFKLYRLCINQNQVLNS